jgi:hypothetical protein
MARSSKRSLEGEIYVDHSASPGIPEDVAVWAGLDPTLCAKGKVYESAILTCSHCQSTIVVNPARTRPREYCSKCDKYICDECAFIMKRTLECRNYEKRLDLLRNQIEKFGSEFGISPLLIGNL